jgi:hypothetical protein
MPISAVLSAKLGTIASIISPTTGRERGTCYSTRDPPGSAYAAYAPPPSRTPLRPPRGRHPAGARAYRAIERQGQVRLVASRTRATRLESILAVHSGRFGDDRQVRRDDLE